MRQALIDVQFIHHPKVEGPLGLCLGADYCAEHEFGIPDLSHALSSNDHLISTSTKFVSSPISTSDQRLQKFERKKATKTLPMETRLVFDCDEEQSTFLIKANNRLTRKVPSLLDRDGPAIFTSWGRSGFMIRAIDEPSIRLVNRLHQGLLDGDVLFEVNNRQNSPFKCTGLSLTLWSKTPESIRQKYHK